MGRSRPSWRPNPPTSSRSETGSPPCSTARGTTLRAGNLLLRAHLINSEARDQLSKERDVRAQAVIDKFQWMTAGTVFANPIPALELMATGAVQYQMISELAAVYGVDITTAHVKMIGTQMIQMLLKTGLVEATTSLIAGLFKSSLVGYAAGRARCKRSRWRISRTSPAMPSPITSATASRGAMAAWARP